MAIPSIKIICHPEFGRVYKLASETVLHAPIDRVFEFFSDAANLQKLTPPWIGFNILTPLPIEMKKGTLIEYRIILHGLPIKWRTEIAEWLPPNRFVDVQLSGPYRIWHHTHSFTPVRQGTKMADEVLYWPLGGRLANKIVVERDVRRIFAFREKEIRRLFGKAV